MHGNNNAYCQDNEISWFDWTLLDRRRELHRFVKTLVGQQRLMLGKELGIEGVSLNEVLHQAACRRRDRIWRCCSPSAQT